jgi:hypothetical protein
MSATAVGRQSDLFLVLDPDDDPQRAAFTRTLNSTSDGRLVAEIRPGTRRLMWIARVLAEALGKSVDVSSTTRNQNLLWERTTAWIAGEQIRDIIIDRAHQLGRREWDALVELAATSNSRLWFIVQQPTLARGLNDAVRDWAIRPLDWPTYQANWDTAEIPGEAPDSVEKKAFAAVPDDDFLTFLGTSEMILDRSHYREVEAVFERARQATASWLGGCGDTPEDWSRRVRATVEAGATLPEAVSALRGIQTAFFLGGLWLQVDLRKLKLGFNAAGSIKFDDELAARLRHYSNPTWAAAAAIRAITGCALTALIELPIGAIDKDATTISVGRREHQVPNCARGIIRAQLELRAWQGATDADPVLAVQPTSLEDAQPYDTKAIQRNLRVMSRELGVELLALKESWKGEGDADWLRHNGITLNALDSHWHV